MKRRRLPSYQNKQILTAFPHLPIFKIQWKFNDGLFGTTVLGSRNSKTPFAQNFAPQLLSDARKLFFFF
jgi:hypothetical protein